MPVNVAFRDEEHFNLLGIQRSNSPQYESPPPLANKNKTVNNSSFVTNNDHNQRDESCSSLQRRKTMKNRHVSFHQIVEVHLVLHVNDMDDEEYFDTWYQKRDLQRIRHEMKKTVSKMNDGSYYYNSKTDLNNEEETSRGLEYRTTAGAQRRKLHKLRALRCVLNEQQRHGTIPDDEALRFAYLRHGIRCAKEAHKRGEMDEEEARQIYQEKVSIHKHRHHHHHHGQ
mmetsp:Transcript_26426/g.61501  ORF Transcript_26426/g.61501 Transcript_26426/m.61501 type:complete len:227 (-) Transcript_26426:94-774(-)|eukprot:CAMPEP_0116834678 /NCGR_PEP_ID=MMETSP0418-20121206/7121_1 /TAXON_ID=1158023 /ORGANISM="Astrosyne radiata, Strain 13vi08-1A" /LENGTH=226 /DNA_ID=CAMNT_0004464257 /DNA_START=55 /DNA_END=735 /DNA_ORIENTATION=-